ncbi:unnamed protein product [Paramecium octaurelia]|uniref:Uncharacterized protein n=1 Tax=Paramecium octaurelia TaxID=43137 RepID=A0A8S1Y465_PAROT|nr:unnamed protein product [Paramecium octaurelia]
MSNADSVRSQQIFPKMTIDLQGGIVIVIKSVVDKELIEVRGMYKIFSQINEALGKQKIDISLIPSNIFPKRLRGFIEEFGCHNHFKLQDEFNKTVRVGRGIYFSNKVDVCINDRYGNHIDVGNKKIAVVFMSRVNPKKIRQSDKMKELDYFVINNSEVVRPNRILLHEKK